MRTAHTATIRSYVLRQRHITRAQRRAWEQHADCYVVSPVNFGGWATAFGRSAPLVVEIGSGNGEATAAMAAADVGRNYIAYEVHFPGVGALIKRLVEGKVTNVRIMHADAVATLPMMFADDSVAVFNIFFPDPWHKKKHHKRRLLSPATLTLLVQKLAVGGDLHFVTDWQPYAEYAAKCFAAEKQLIAAPPPPRATTAFETRAIVAGRAVHTFYFRKCE